ncbi:hypothetical protein ACQP25_30855 [Microtetraspora malaysiensis]|uniref:hypothetical protein n=1 Tax=Microtetraspora malaysiensis TaxID=161358 RepID=UPI003D8BDD01
MTERSASGGAPLSSGQSSAHWPKAIAQLEELAAELKTRGFAARVHAGDGTRPKLLVINTAAPVLMEEIHVVRDSAFGPSFFFPWPQVIAPIHDIDGAAGRIERVLAEVGR